MGQTTGSCKRRYGVFGCGSSPLLVVEERHGDDGDANLIPGCKDLLCRFLTNQTPFASKYPGLGTWEDVPEYQRRFAILSGYRLNTEGCIPCLESAFFVHNETVNIWSHALGIVAVASWLLQAVELEGSTGRHYFDNVLVVAHAIVTMCCFGLSAFYHCRSCDEETVCFRCFYADLSGVVAVIVSAKLVSYALCFQCRPAVMAAYFLSVVIELIVMATVAKCPDASDATRGLVFSACCLFTLVPCAHFLLVAQPPYVELMKVRVMWMNVFQFIGTIAYVFRLPEKWLPGKFDLLGQSHNIFHLCVLAAMMIFLDMLNGLAALNASMPC